MNSFKLVINIFFYLIFFLFLISCGSKEVKKSKEFIEAGMYSEAIDLLKIEIQQNPKNAEAQHLLGYVHLLIDRENNADEYFHRSQLLDNDYIKERTDTYFKAGNILIRKNPRLAIHYLDISTAKNSDLLESASNLCFITAKDLLLSSGKFSLGINLIDKSLEYNPSLLSPISTFCITTAEHEFANNNFDRAITLLNYCKDESNLSKKNSIRLQVGFKLWKQGKSSFAKSCFFDAINDGANIESSDSLYYAYYVDLLNSDLNIKVIDHFISVFPKSSFCPELLWKKANIYFRAANLEKSKGIFNELLKNYSNSNLGKLAKKRLEIWPDALVLVSSSSKWIDIGIPIVDANDGGFLFENFGKESVKIRFKQGGNYWNYIVEPRSKRRSRYSGKILNFEAILFNDANCLLATYMLPKFDEKKMNKMISFLNQF